MRFGPLRVEEACGAVLAHSVAAGGKTWRKAHRLTADDVAVLSAEGVAEVVAAVIEPADLDENAPPSRIAEALDLAGVSRRRAATGRVNLHAEEAGVFGVDAARIDAINAIDPAITIATLPDMATVAAGQMVATVKIIPFAVAERLVEAARSAAGAKRVLAVHPFAPRRVGLIQTVTPNLKASVLDKTEAVTLARLARSGSVLAETRRVAHDAGAIEAALREVLPGCGLVLVFGASAVSDPGDVIPLAIRAAGGHVERVGMPVDPGNLLVLGSVGNRPVVGAPGCARSPRPNGFDWVLDRLLAGIPVTSKDIAGMGVGGLLMEIASRPHPREAPPRGAKVAAILLAAGLSSRMGGPNKLLAAFDGEALVARVARRLAASRATPLVAVVGHQADRVRQALGALPLRIVENADHASGIAGSLRTGLAALPSEADGALVALADMPRLRVEDVERMIDAFEAAGGGVVVRAVHDGKAGNPVILPHALFAAASALTGDAGARHLIETSGLEIVPVEIGDAAAVDVDTPEAMRRAGGVLA